MNDTIVEQGATDEDAPPGEVTARKPMPIVGREPDVGKRIGRYVVVGPLGSGGMGAVYRAYDPKLQREVALKRLHADAPAWRGEARMIREARAMAQLSHPNVVAVYDVEAAPDGVTLAMECVNGRTLKAWLGEPHRTSEVITVLIAAGRGLAAAHTAGLVHRDFKPANVLVTSDGIPKVTDFGLAKAFAGAGSASAAAAEGGGEPLEITPEVEVTQAGAVVGTPLYMAPEQIAGAVADARSDQYAYCVTAWQALFGAPPFSGTGDALVAAKAAGPSVPARSTPVPRAMVAALRRGLQPDPARRFATMGALLAELEAASLRRRRVWAVVGGAAAFVAVGALWLRAPAEGPCARWDRGLDTQWSPARASTLTATFEATGLPYAPRAARRAVAQLDAYTLAWNGQRKGLCEATEGDTTIERDADAALQARCLDRAREDLGAAIDVLSATDADALARAHDVIAGLPRLEDCADVDALRAEPAWWADEDRFDGAAALASERARAQALSKAGRFEEARAVAQAAMSRAEAREAFVVQAELSGVLGRALRQLGRFDEAEATYRAGLDAALRGRADRITAELALDFAFALANDRVRIAEAEHLLAIGTAIAQRPNTDAALRAKAESTAGTVDKMAGRFEPAAEHHRRSLEIRLEHLGSEHPHVAVSRTNLGLVLYDQNRYEDAVAEQRAALEIWKQAFGEDHPEVALARANLAMSLDAAGHFAEAEAEHRASLASRIATFGPRHPSVAKTRNNLAITLRTTGRAQMAVEEATEAVAIWREALGETHAHVAVGHNTLGQALVDIGRVTDAAVHFEAAVAITEAALPAEHPTLPKMLANLADARRSLGQLDVAEAIARRGLDIRARNLGDDALETGRTRIGLAHVLLDAGRTDEAAELAARGWATLQRTGTPAGETFFVAWIVVRSRWPVAPAEARAIARSVLAQGEPGASVRERDAHAQLVAWLEEHP